MSSPTARRRRLPSLLSVVAAVLLAAIEVRAARLPGPLVYVVTASPASRQLQIDAAPSRGVSYYGGRRRSDAGAGTTTPRPRIDTPDLIFAEFEADGGREGDAPKKSIRKLLENERIRTSTPRPVAVPPPVTAANTSDLIFAEFEAGMNRKKSIKTLLNKERITGEADPVKMSPSKYSTSSMNNHKDEYHAVYNSLFEEKLPQGPIVVSEPETNPISTTEAAIEEEETLAPLRVEDIWHVIHNEQGGGQEEQGGGQEKQGQQAGGWEEVPLGAQPTMPTYFSTIDENEAADTEQPPTTTQPTIDNPYGHNFVYPGFSSNDDKSTENESRAIRTESNIRFPYVNLKTYQMKGRPTNEKGNNLYTSVDKFRDEKNPLRGEAQDAGPPLRPQIDRYNPAQPYLPPSPYGSTNKQSPAAPPKPVKTVANLIPPPLPPPPRRAPTDFSPPDTYESFPPYAPSPLPAAPPKAPKPALTYRPPPPLPAPPPPSVSGDDDSDLGPPPPSSGNADSAPPSPDASGSDDGGYDYKPPSSGDGGYDYSPPSSGGYSYRKPLHPPLAPPPDDPAPLSPPSPPEEDAPHFPGYSYKKPHDTPDETDYPELIYSKPHMPKPAMMGGDMMKGVEMMPPPPPMGKPDFPNLSFDSSPPEDVGYKHHYHHDFEDYDHYPHHHHHTTTTTTTTTEMPRVNRFSYYYLGKKLYYLPLYFSVYFVVYVGALIIKAVLRHKIVYPNSWHAPARKRRELAPVSLSPEHLHEVTRRVTNALMMAAEKYTGSEKT